MNLPNRTAKSCWQRWTYEMQGKKLDTWTEDEDHRIVDLIEKFGTSWSKISKYMPGRSNNQIKNRYNSRLRRTYDIRPLSRFGDACHIPDIKKNNRRKPESNKDEFDDSDSETEQA